MPAGRPTDYRPEYCKTVYNLCLLGATDKEMAGAFDVSESTFNLWKLEYPEFSESIKKGKITADGKIGRSLYNRAKGFRKKAVKLFQNDGEVIEHEYLEYYPPDPTSMIYWLKNRRGRVNEAEGAQKWADKHEHVHDGTIVSKLVFENDKINEPIKDADD